MAALACLGLLLPGGFLEPMWRVNPDARRQLGQMGGWAPLLMAVVSAACALASSGLWRRRRWGHRLAIGILVVNLAGDAANAVLRGDLRTLIGLPIGGLMIAWLLSPLVRAWFGRNAPSGRPAPSLY